MTDEEKYNLLYRPEMAPEEDYMSDSDFIHRGFLDTPLEIPDTPQAPKIFDPQTISDDLQEIIEMFPALPESLQFYKPTIEKIKKRLDIIIPDLPSEYTPAPGTTPPKTKPEKVTPVKTIPMTYVDIEKAPENFISLFPNPKPVNISVVPPKSIVQMVKTDYARDQVHLDSYYTQRLQLVMQKYFQRVLVAMADCGIENIDDMTREFDADSVQIPAGQSLEHLRDHIARSQITRGQKERFFKKTHSVDKTLLHMRAWHAAEMARERYYLENYGDSGTFAESHSNALLRENRAAYDNAYTASLYNMFRYLDSSTAIMNDTLEMTAKEVEAKSMLLKKGVNIFETDETDTVGEAQAALAAEGNAQAAENAQSGGTMNPTSGSDGGSTSKSGDSTTGSDSDEEDSGKNGSTSDVGDTKTPAIGGGIFGGLFNTYTSDPNKYGPNGKKYSKNDIEYLTNQGYSKEQAIDILSKDTKYTTPYKGPNGRKYSDNDVTYLTNQGYSKEQAYEILSKDDKYTRNRPWDTLGKNVATQASNVVSGILNGVVNNINDVASGKMDIKDLGKSIKNSVQNGANSLTAGVLNTVTQTATTYATDWANKTMNNAINHTGDSYGPNGRKYEQNDIKYLTDRGYTKADARKALSKEAKYTEPYRGANGKKFSQNDIDYLVNQGYSKDQAYEILSKDEKYTKETLASTIGKNILNAAISSISNKVK